MGIVDFAIRGPDVFEEVVWFDVRIPGDVMLEGSNVFVIYRIEDEVAEGCDCCLILHELVLFEGELSRGFNLRLVCSSIVGLESRIGRYDEWDIVGDFCILLEGYDKGEVA